MGVSTALFSVELEAFAQAVGATPRRQLVLVLDGAGWHTNTSHDLQVPEHVHLLFLPSPSPELQPCEHLWQCSDAPLVNRHFRDIGDLATVPLARCAALRCAPAAT
jgi:hypothetical protein